MCACAILCYFYLSRFLNRLSLLRNFADEIFFELFKIPTNSSCGISLQSKRIRVGLFSRNLENKRRSGSQRDGIILKVFTRLILSKCEKLRSLNKIPPNVYSTKINIDCFHQQGPRLTRSNYRCLNSSIYSWKQVYANVSRNKYPVNNRIPRPSILSRLKEFPEVLTSIYSFIVVSRNLLRVVEVNSWNHMYLRGLIEAYLCTDLIFFQRGTAQ